MGNVGYVRTILIGPRLLHSVSLELGRTKSGNTPKAENARRKAVDAASNSGDLLHGQCVRRRILAFSTSAVCSYHPMHGLAEAIGRGNRRPRYNEFGIPILIASRWDKVRNKCPRRIVLHVQILQFRHERLHASLLFVEGRHTADRSSWGR